MGSRSGILNRIAPADRIGPIVRVNPWELSIRDSSYYGELHVASSTRRTDMWPRGREGVGILV